MTATITTTGTANTSGSVSTTSTPGESKRDLVSRHFDEMDTAGSKGDPPPLETTYPTSGGTHTVTTNQNPGESNEMYVKRHQILVALDMVEYPLVM